MERVRMKGDVIKPIRSWWWLLVLDVLYLVGAYGSKSYWWAVERAADCEEW